MKAEIVSVGTELLLGQIHDTNATYLCQELAKLGVDVFYRTTVGDNRGRICEALRCALERSDLVIVTGGLGPTADDVTREAIAEVLELPLEEDEATANRIAEFFARRGLPMLPSVRKQALIPATGKAIVNDAGTAPGILVQKEEKTIFAVPGVPHEMRSMAEGHLLPYLKHLRESKEEVISSKVLYLSGIGESAAAQKIEDLLSSPNPTVAPLVSTGVVNFRITAKGSTSEEAQRLIEEQEGKIRQRLGDYIFGTNGETLESVVGELLVRKGLALATAESCTAGLLAGKLTDVSGSSRYYVSSVVAYSNEAKVRFLGVSPEVIRREGAVSAGVARQMAEGVRKLHGVDIGISLTGIAGPTGGTRTKPVGLVFMGLADRNNTQVVKHQFVGSRQNIRARAVQAALDMLWRYLR